MHAQRNRYFSPRQEVVSQQPASKQAPGDALGFLAVQVNVLPHKYKWGQVVCPPSPLPWVTASPFIALCRQLGGPHPD